MSSAHSASRKPLKICRSTILSRYSVEYFASAYELLVPVFQQEIRESYVHHGNSDHEENAREQLLAAGVH